jgi:hypothetical protein
VFVPGSRRYAGPTSFLLTAERWVPQRVEFCHLVGKPVEAGDALAQPDDELHAALGDLEAQLVKGNPGEVRLTADGELVIPPLTAEDTPTEAEALREELAAMLPRVPLASVLVEMDARTGFTDHLVRAGGKVARPAELSGSRSRASPSAPGTCPATSRAGKESPPTPTCPTSTPPTTRRSSSRRRRSRTTCWTASSATRPTCRSTSTPPTRTARRWPTSPCSTWVGKQLSPRIRDLGKITLYRTGRRSEFLDRYPRCGPLLTRRLDTDLVVSMWDDLLRVAASVKGGHATAALVVGKLCSSKRQQNALTSAIKEYGASRRTVYAAQYLADETYRRRIGRQLNKGENLHALRRNLAYAGEGRCGGVTTSSRASRCGA